MTLETPVWLQQGAYPAQQDRLLTTALVNAGIPDGPADPVAVPPTVGDLAVTADGSTLAVDVAPGVCFINGTDQTRQGVYVCRNTATVVVPVNPRPASGLTRIDLVYAQVIDTSAGISGTDGWTIGVVAGVPAGSNPTVPALPASALALAQVTVANAGGSTLVAGNVADVRARATSRLHAPLPVVLAGPLYLTAPSSYAIALTPIPGTALQVIAPGGRKIRVSLQMMCQANATVASLLRGFVMTSPNNTTYTAVQGSIGPTVVAGGYWMFSLAYVTTPPAGSIWYAFGLQADTGSGRVFADAGAYPGWIMAENLG